MAAGGTSKNGHQVGIEQVSQRFADQLAVNDVSISVGEGELVALLGPSGCGKSTLLRIVPGFIRQTSGRILFDGASVDHLAANRRGVGIVFQNYALFPHMTVRENIAYGLQARKWNRAEIAPRVDEMLARVQMSAFGERTPRQLSGGQQQRIALARCLATDPKVLLLDEPFAALDKNLRFGMQVEIKRLQREYGITTIMVTHDQEEALSMADRIAVMNKGHLEQIAAPTEIYDNPATLFVNQFVGASNLLPGTLVSADAESSLIRLDNGATLRAGRPRGVAAGARVVVTLRPEQIILSASATDFALAGRIASVMPLGPQIAYEVELSTTVPTALKIIVPRGGAEGARGIGETVFATPAAPSACHVFAA